MRSARLGCRQRLRRAGPRATATVVDRPGVRRAGADFSKAIVSERARVATSPPLLPAQTSSAAAYKSDNAADPAGPEQLGLCIAGAKQSSAGRRETCVCVAKRSRHLANALSARRRKRSRSDGTLVQPPSACERQSRGAGGCGSACALPTHASRARRASATRPVVGEEGGRQGRIEPPVGCGPHQRCAERGTHPGLIGRRRALNTHKAEASERVTPKAPTAILQGSMSHRVRQCL